MITRRRFFQSTSSLAGGLLSGCGGALQLGNGGEREGHVMGKWFMPDEGEPHDRTWMAFGPSEEVWGADLLPRVREDLARIANAVARFEPVTMLVRSEDRALAEELCDEGVELVETAMDDLWIRDTGPCFVLSDEGSLGAVDLNFNGWGEKQEYDQDALVARFLARRSGATYIETDVVGEGGGIEVDGHGTAIITESCFVNANRNPGRSRTHIEAELTKRLGPRKIIWLPGIAGKDITDGHTDFYARFVRPGVVVAALDTDPRSFDHAVTLTHLEILKDATDADGRQLEIVTLTAPADIRTEFAGDDFAAGYINFYVCNGAVIAPQFGDAKADAAAKHTLERLFPGRTVVQLDIDGIAAGGGGIHCATQQQPKV
ncbi:MAG: agmatine deiminase family protein [Chloroflexi bacterium]|nr:agmatine deiminase family protein [Chloroflexota bacterium]